MNYIKRAIYSSLVFPARIWQHLFLNLHVWGRENIPKGPKIFVSNHIASTDPHWLTLVFNEPVHWVIGPGYQTKIMTRILDFMEHINAMPEHRKTVAKNAAVYLNRGESVYIAPEGDIQEPFQLGKFYPGVAKIYRAASKPIVPIALAAPKHAMRNYSNNMVVDGRIYRTVTVLRGPFLINIGEPMMPDIPDGSETTQNEQITQIVKERIESLLEDIRLNKFWQ